jgi:hypothetical protein
MRLLPQLRRKRCLRFISEIFLAPIPSDITGLAKGAAISNASPRPQQTRHSVFLQKLNGIADAIFVDGSKGGKTPKYS